MIEQEDIQTEAVPRDGLIDMAIFTAIETAEPKRSVEVHHGVDTTEWEYSDVEFDEIEIVGQEEISLRGETEVTWEEKIANAGRWQPAEYQTHIVTLEIEILLTLQAEPEAEVRVGVMDW